MTSVKFCKLFGNKLAFTNGSGFPGHANYILGEELDQPDPRFDQARICGGAVVAEKKHDDQYVWIETIDVRKPIPSAEYVMARPWLYYHATLAGDIIRMFPQGEGKPVYVPLLSALSAQAGVDGVKLPRWKLQKWTKPELPDPYTVYI